MTLINYFKKWVAEMPDTAAITHQGKALTFRELDELSDELAIRFMAAGPLDKFVGLSASKNKTAIIGMLAIIKAGRAYLPLDPSYPAERIYQMVQNADIKHIICDEKENAFFGDYDLIPINSSFVVADNRTEPATMPFPLPGVGELVALLYTSGSTGGPKGVCMTHAGMFNLIKHQLNSSKAARGAQNLLFSHLSFDASFQEIFVSLASGGTLHIIDESIRLDAALLLRYIDQYAINRIFVPYVVLQYLTENALNLNSYPSSLREITTGGELLKITPAIRAFFARTPHCTLVNVYGPTETSIWVTDLRLSGNAHEWPDIPTIGTPITKGSIFLLNDQMQEVAREELGEIHVGGVGVSQGYLKREELTREHFLDWVDGNGQPQRLYRTGDIGRLLPNGEIEFHGRADHQVKIRGNRVELGEIEIHLAKLPTIAQVVVTLREDSPGIRRLVAYLIAKDGRPHDLASIRKHIAKHLPDYMIPSAFVWMENFPKTTSGKVDRRALPAPEIERPDIGALYKKPGTENERKITALWSALLLIDKVGVDDNFFELGGNSLLAQQTVAQLRQHHGLEIPVTHVYQYPTATQLASVLAGNVVQAAGIKLPGPRKGEGRAIAIIGMEGRFPGAASVAELWANLCAGRENVTFFDKEELDGSIPREVRDDPNYVGVRGIIERADEFDAKLLDINPTMAKLMDPQQRIFLEICRDVLEAAGYLASRDQHRIGIYAGTGNNTYFQNNLQHHPEEIAKIGAFQVMLANEKDYIATRTAYQLNLNGPAVSLNTACSTSLVAVAQAVDAIRNGQCDMAIAGGVSITVPIQSGHLYEEGAMFSTDGHTRPFDAEATGTVFSDGAGVVLLKDLKLAEADGDTVYAVVQGVGLSNDGGGKGSFMAPSATGQAAAIRMAMADAGFLPESVGYIEAHGTATPLGDPIEIEGLKLAFGEVPEKHCCRIGSIKGNIGHLTHAAGVAGLIKAAMSLHHRIIPPSINFSQPNPAINFPETPFAVSESLFTWNKKERFRMGVSSFGVGGTNAHVALEAYINQSEQEAGTTIKQPVLINWSAKTATSGQAYAERLYHFLKDHPEEPLHRIAYTLQTTREHFSNRFTVVADNRDQLAEKLAANQWIAHELQEKGNGLAFLFPGQGAQYPHMGHALYQNEPIYRAAVDRCAEILLREMGEDIRTIIFTDDNNADSGNLRNTYYTQPALFVTSYALAKLWLSRGVTPQSFIGHSVGEFVAAHLSGIFSLEDALHLIAIRGRLCNAIPAGGMLSVRAASDRIAPLLPEELSIAAVNAPNLCVVAGPQTEIDRLTDVLEAKQIPCKPLHTSHAFHSSMMLPILDGFKDEVKQIRLGVPQIPIVSTVTGTWLKDEEATSPEYWANHLVATVRFSDAVVFLEQELSPIYLESGPGQVTATLVKQHGTAYAKKAFSSLYHTENDEQAIFLQALGSLWLHGIDAHWGNLYHEEHTHLTHNLPTYAYDRKSYWIGQKSNTKALEHEYQHTIHTTVRKDLLIYKVKELLEEASGIDIADAPMQANFIEIGFDSLLLTQIAQSLKKAFGIPITFRMLNDEYPTLDRLGDYLDKHLPADAFQPPAATPTAQPEKPLASVVSAHQPALLPQPDTISLIAQQISLLSQQIALLQGVPATSQHAHPSYSDSRPTPRNGHSMPSSPPPAIAKNDTAAQSETPLAPEEVAELKKPFGATARIDKQTALLDADKAEYLSDFIDQYVAKTAKSKAYTQHHRSYMADPRVVSGFKPTTKEMTYSIVTNRSKGCRLWDIDGNEYIDALNGFGSNMLGYQPDFITEALHQQIDEGYEVGPQHEKAGEVCQLICELTRMERAALCNTGSEAVLGAMRIARTVTGRNTIVAFSNSYHGIVDEVIVRGTKKLKTFPAAPGILPEAVQHMLILEYGTPESLEIIRERANDIAAILVEPIQSRRPEFQPIEFVRELRSITTESGTALIFDEVITGFRMHLHGMQHLWGIEADLATYGKVVGSGISVGVIAGKRAFMDALDGGYWQYGDGSVPEVGVTYFAGTFVRHPLALASTKAALAYLKDQGPQLQENLTSRTTDLAHALNKVCKRYQTPLFIVHFGSLWKIKYHDEFPYSDLLFAAMRLRGIHIQDGFPCFLTTAHTDGDIRRIIHAFEGSVHDLVRAGFISTTLAANNVPPIPHARLGRDEEGNAAWFVPDKKKSGKYLQVVTS